MTESTSPGQGHTLRWGIVSPILVCVLVTLSASRSLRGQDEWEHERSGLWVRAGFDLGRLQVDSQHGGTLAGVRFAAGWALSQQVSAGLRTAIYRAGAGEPTNWLLGPEVAWYPFGSFGLALRGGVNVLDFHERSELVTADNPLVVRQQRFRGLLGHAAVTVSKPIGEHVLFEAGLEFGYAPTGTWRDNTTPPVKGQPWSKALLLGFGID